MIQKTLRRYRGRVFFWAALPLLLSSTCWNGSARAAQPGVEAAAQGLSEKEIEDLIKQSDVYQAVAVELNGEAEYTEWLASTDSAVDHASLTFLDFLINGDSSSNRSKDQLPATNDMPRFVDVALGLVSAKEMQQAMRLYATQGSSAADEFIQTRERVYTRRIFLRNTGTATLTF